MERAFRRLERQVPPPVEQQSKDGFVLRYQERTIEQALIQKLARQVSGLHAIDALLLKGLAQEQGVIQRTLDEIGEDIHFLVLAVTTGEVTPLHQRYLEEFWQEEFDHPDPIKATQKRGMVQRQKIRAFNARAGGIPDPSTMDAVGHTVHKAYSGFVHAASPHVMDMLEGSPPTFQISGMKSGYRRAEHVEDAWNYFYRGLLSVTMVAMAFRDASLVDHMYAYFREFEAASGTEYTDGGFHERPTQVRPSR
jgi:hypothetical protein